MDALQFLDRAAKAKPQPLYAVTGDEAFLKREVLAALKTLLLGYADADFAWSAMPGDRAEWSAVRSELDTLPFLSPRPVVVVESADPFVTRFRATLEKYPGQPSKSGVLILDVKTWPSNTKLAKLVPDAATITCKTPRGDQVLRWCTQRASATFNKRLDPDAGAWLLEMVGLDLGLLDQELAKLAVYVGDSPAISRDDVDQLVGRSRAAETFKMFDAIGNGRADDALALLDRLLDQGDEPLKILGAFSWQLTRLARVGRAMADGRTIQGAL